MNDNDLLDINRPYAAAAPDIQRTTGKIDFEIAAGKYKLKSAVFTGVGNVYGSNFQELLAQIAFNDKLEVTEFRIKPNTFEIEFDADGQTNVTFDAAPCNNIPQGSFTPIPPATVIKISQFVKQGDLEDIRTAAQFDEQMNLMRGDFYSRIAEQNPTYVFLRALKRLYESESNPKGSDAVIQYPNDSKAQELYLEALTAAIEHTEFCASKTASGSSGTEAADYDKGTQVGRFGIQLTNAINQRWRGFVKSGGETQAEKDKKNAGKTKDKKEETEAPIASVNPTISQLEAKRAQIEADNKIIYVNSSGVNTFSAPAGDPNNVYSILDIMRDEQSAYIFESETVSINTVKDKIASGDSNSGCEKLLAQLNPAQLMALLKTIQFQIDYNTRIMERTSQLINKLKNSPSFKLTAMWTGLGNFSLGSLNWNGFHFDTSAVSKVQEGVKQAASETVKTTTQAATQAAGQVVDAGKSIGQQVKENVSGMLSMGGKALTDNFEDLMANIKANSAALKEALSGISFEDLSACRLVNEIQKAANAAGDVQSAVNNIQARAQKDLQSMTSKIEVLKTVNEQQARLTAALGTVQKLLKSKLGG